MDLMLKNLKINKYIVKLLPFWIFLILFKTAACIHFNMLSPYGERVLPIWMVGLVIGGASLLQLILDVPAGLIMDRFGYRRFLKVTTVLFIIAVLPLVFNLSPWTYIFTALAGGFGWLFFGPGTNAYVISHASNNNAGEFIGVKNVSDSIGGVISAAIFVLSITLPTRVVAIAIIIIFVLSFIALSFTPIDSTIDHSAKKLKTQSYYIRRKHLAASIKSIKKLNPAALMLVASSLSSSIFYAIVWFVVPLAITAHTMSGSADLALGVFDIGVVLTGSIIGKIADKSNKRRLIFLGLLIFAVIGIFLGFSNGFAFLLLGFIGTMGDESSNLSIWAWLNALDKDHDADGLVSGVVCAFSDLGWAIGPVVGGFLYPVIGLGWTVAVGGFAILAVWLFYSTKAQKLYQSEITFDSQAEKKPHHYRHKH
jgi:MFS family permease